MTLIGLAGPPGAGKRTVADYLRDHHGFARIFYTAIGSSSARYSAPGIVVVDLTSNHEAEYIRHHVGQIWLLQRPGYLTRAGDLYRGINPSGADRGLLNDGPIDALYNRVEKLLDDLSS